MEHPYLTHQTEIFKIFMLFYDVHKYVVLHWVLCENEYKWSFNV